MKDFSELLAGRRSCRKYTDEPVSEDDILLLLKAGLMSPTSHNGKSWRFVVVDDKETLKLLSTSKEAGASMLSDAALAIVVCADSLSSDVWVEDASVASAMILMQAEDLGLGACWVQIRERNTMHGTPLGDYVRNILGIPMQFEVVSIISIGHKAGTKPPVREEDLQWEKVYINRYEDRE